MIGYFRHYLQDRKRKLYNKEYKKRIGYKEPALKFYSEEKSIIKRIFNKIKIKYLFRNSKPITKNMLRVMGYPENYIKNMPLKER